MSSSWRFRFAWLVPVCLLLIGCEDSDVRLGREAMNAGDYDRALNLLTVAAGRNSSDASVKALIAQVYARKGSLREALQALRDAQRLGLSGEGVGAILQSAAASAVDENIPWQTCLKTPRRECVFAQALQLTKSIPDERSRVTTLASIADAQANAGLSKEAQATIEVALSQVQVMKSDFTRANILNSISKTQVVLGRKNDAQATSAEATRVAETLTGNDREFTLLATKVQAGNTDEAWKIAQSIRDEDRRVDAMLPVIEAQLKSGRSQEAVVNIGIAAQLAQSIKNQSGMIRAALGIAEVQSKAGLKSEATATLQQIAQTALSSNLNGRPIFLNWIARAWANAGNFSEGLRLARFIDDQGLRAAVLAYIAETQFKAGLSTQANATLDEAVELAASLPRDNQQFALSSIAKTQAIAGKIAESLLSVQFLIVEKNDRVANALNSIAQALPK